MSSPITSGSTSRSLRLATELREVFEEASGIEIGENEVEATFIELGFDSLLLTQVALAVQKKTGVKLNFRQLLEDMSTIRTLADHVDRQLPPEKAAPSVPPPAATPVPLAVPSSAAAAPIRALNAGTQPPPPPVMNGRGSGAALQSVIEQQLQLMARQLALLQGQPNAAALVAPIVPAVAVTAPAENPSVPASSPTAVPPAPPTTRALADETAPPSEAVDVAKKPFGAIARISLGSEELTPRQRARLDALVRRYNARTKASKKWTQDHRAVMADPRVVTGFRPAIKELVYPIVIKRSAGPKLWDLDGNEYVDVLMGFGCNMFGWQPEFVTKAVEEQLRTGHEIGPQSTLAGECAELVCEFTGFDRAAFCNTGSEAVMGTVRVARTVTGRSKIALFTGSYHGIFDEVIVRATKKHTGVPAAPGIMKSTAENVLVLDYGTRESLDIIRANSDDLAAVLVEPIQSRRPDFQPREFLHDLRALTAKTGTVLIFDEVITGFRLCPGGAQEHFGVKADIASYGKIIGGGLPIGAIAGKREYMDALDGGHWQFGDASAPMVGVTYFAGTFVRHPLALAAMKSVLLHLKEKGPALQRETNAKATRLAGELNAFFKSAEAPLEIRHFGSLWKTFFTAEHPYGDLLFVLLRDRGIHIMDGFPCFFTTTHSQADVDAIVAAFKSAVAEMQESGFFPEPAAKSKGPAFDAARPPVPGARLGRNADGTPGWFVPNPSEPGKYLKVENLP